MTDKGIKKCFGALQGAYKSFYKDNTTNDWVIMKEVWQIQFGNADDREVFFALNKCFSTCKYPPSIAEIKQAMLPEDDFNEEEEWGILLRASRANRDDAYEQWEKLPEDLKKLTTPNTLMEIGRADDEAVRFIKKDVIGILRARHRKNIDRRLTSQFTDTQFIEEGEEDLLLPFYEDEE